MAGRLSPSADSPARFRSRQRAMFGVRHVPNVTDRMCSRIWTFGMTENFSDVALREWLVDYLVTNIGCNPDEIDLDASLNDLGVGSRDSIVLSGELSELLGRPVSPVEFWEHPTTNALVGLLTGSGAEPGPGAAAD